LEGRNAMIKKFVCGLVVLSSFGFGLIWAADAFTGTWTLNVAKSKFAKGQEYKELTVNVAEQGDDAMVTGKGTGGADNAFSYKYTVPIKGGTVNYTEGGPAAGTTVVTKRVDANTIDFTDTMNGKQVGAAHAVLSADGKTLTIRGNGVDQKGKAFKSVLIYNRQ
jgi:hypothetical protein